MYNINIVLYTYWLQAKDSARVKYVTEETTATPNEAINQFGISSASNPSLVLRDRAIAIAGGIIKARVPCATPPIKLATTPNPPIFVRP